MNIEISRKIKDKKINLKISFKKDYWPKGWWCTYKETKYPKYINYRLEMFIYEFIKDELISCGSPWEKQEKSEFEIFFPDLIELLKYNCKSFNVVKDIEMINKIKRFLETMDENRRFI